MLSGTSVTLLTTCDRIENWVTQFYDRNKDWIENGYIEQVSNDKVKVFFKVQREGKPPGWIEFYLYLNWPDRVFVRGGYQGCEADFDTLWNEMLAEFGEKRTSSNGSGFVRDEERQDSKIYTYDFPASEMTKAEKLEAYEAWCNRDKFNTPNYERWAEIKFNGYDPSGTPKVPYDTLMGWRRYETHG